MGVGVGVGLEVHAHRVRVHVDEEVQRQGVVGLRVVRARELAHRVYRGRRVRLRRLPLAVEVEAERVAPAIVGTGWG